MNNYKLIKVEKEYYILSNDYFNVGDRVGEKLTNGNWMVMTIHNENDFDFKNQMKIIASTRTDLINSPETGLMFIVKDEIEDHLKHFVENPDVWSDLKRIGLTSDQCSEVCDYIENNFVSKRKEENKVEWDIDISVIPARDILNSGVFDVIRLNKFYTREQKTKHKQ